jgi:asparagine synthase (glutamine-hydrolysing)
LQLLAPFGAPWPLNAASVWRGVAPVEPGHFLRAGADGIGRTERWWTPPEPELPLAESAESIREALVAAVEARTASGQPFSADLSGGMDSAVLCYLAARSGLPMTTVHYETVDPANHDPVWAARCRPDLPDAEHLVIPPGAMPGPYSELATMAPDADLEAPLSLIRRATVEYLTATVAGAGSRRHLMGLGSDELFRPSHMCLNAVARRHPLRAVRQVRAKKSMRRWSWLTTMRGLAAAGPYPRWLAEQADRLAVERRWDDAAVDWEVAAKMPLWATADAVDAARRLVRDAAAAEPEPLAAIPVQHEMIRLTRINGTMVRRASRVGEASDVSFQAPFLDDRVLEAALSVRLADRMAYGWAKPVLSAAMRDIAPADLLARKDKGDQSPELFVTLRRYRRELMEFCDEARLVRLGMVDPEVLRTVMMGLHPDARHVLPFDSTLQTELWLRSLPSRHAPAGLVTQGARG